MPRSKQTKHLLAQSLQELLATMPLEKISVNDIVEQAGVGRNTFYYHFEDKYDLVNWYFQSGVTEFLVNRSSYTSWESLLFAMEEYFRENGHLNVPKNYDTQEGLHLGQWLCTQRALYRNDRYHLTTEQISRLESIGMQWQRYDDQRWEVNYEAALRFYETHGHLRVTARYVTPEGIRLGRWITNLRQKFNAGDAGNSLTEEQIQQM